MNKKGAGAGNTTLFCYTVSMSNYLLSPEKKMLFFLGGKVGALSHLLRFLQLFRPLADYKESIYSLQTIGN
jgi:hypothetical protein